MVLQVSGVGQTLRWSVAAHSGTTPAPAQTLAVPAWTIRQGSPVSGRQPPQRVVRFYAPGRVKPKLLCLVDVRYFRDGRRWRPYYRMDEQMFFTKRAGRWVPLALMHGVPSLISATPTGFANAAGYVRGLTFSQTTGPITLVGWQVARVNATALPAP